ncbi:MAG: terminase small subunit [Ruthenibacterium sp.]
MASARKISEKQRRFADYYLELGNISQSCIKAGYSESYANAQGYKLLENVGVREYIDERLAELEEQRVASAAEVMQYLTAVMRRERAENIVVTVTQEKSAFEPDQNGTMRKVTVKQEVPQIVEIPAKLSDANKAAELLGKRYGLFRDGIDVSGDLDLHVEIDYGDVQEDADSFKGGKLCGFFSSEGGKGV